MSPGRALWLNLGFVRAADGESSPGPAQSCKSCLRLVDKLDACRPGQARSLTSFASE